MNYQRKRVAKRLASGLLAGALALGGLAISGASPASANTATTSRMSGINRYGTSVAIADALQANAFANVVLVSGENFPDALAAASLAAILDADAGNGGVQTAPILLTAKDSLPAEVENFLVNTANVATTAKFTIVGGTSAVSTAVSDRLVALGFAAANISRVSGADRYATAVAISSVTGVVDAADEVIIASGTNPADAMTGSALANAKGWPILLAGPDGLDAATQARLKAILTLTTTDKIHILGGASAVPTSVENQIVSTAVGGKPSIINRIEGADRYATAAAIAAVNVAATAADGSKVALLNGVSWADALSAAPYLAKNDTTPILVESGSLPASSAAFLASNGAANPTSIVSIGGTSAVGNSVSASALASNLLSATPVAGVMVAGVSTSVTFTFAGTTAASFETITGLDCAGNGAGDADQSFKMALFTVNGSTLAAFGGADTDAAVVNNNCVVTVERTAAFAAGDIVSFVGLAEDNAAPVGSTTHTLKAAASAPAAADTTKPSVSLLGITEDATGGITDIYLKISEAGLAAADFAAGEVEVYTAADLADNGVLNTDKCDAPGNTATVTETYADFAATIVKVSCGDGTAALTNLAIGAGWIIKVDADALTDASGNKNLEAQLVVALDTTKPTVTLGSVAATQSTAAVFTVPGAITLTTTATSAIAGHVANGWRVVVNNSTAPAPSVSVDTATRRITFSANLAVHDSADLLWAVGKNATAAALGTWALVGAGTAKVSATYDSGNTIAPGTAGASTFKVVATASELIQSPTSPLTVATGSTINTCAGGTVSDYTAGLTTFTINCTALNAGVVADLVIAGLKDLSGNDGVGAAVKF